MKISLKSWKTEEGKKYNPPLTIISAYSTTDSNGNTVLDNSHWPSSYVSSFNQTKSSTKFVGELNDKFLFPVFEGKIIMAMGLGPRENFTLDTIRTEFEDLFNSLLFGSMAKLYETLAIDADYFIMPQTNLKKTVNAIAEGLYLADFPYYGIRKNDNVKPILSNVVVTTNFDGEEVAKAKEVFTYSNVITDSSHLDWEGDLVSDIKKYNHQLNGEV